MNWRWKVAQFWEIRWWQRYLGRREKERYLEWKKAYWRQLLQALPLTLQKGDRILEAGCGPAGVFLVLEDYSVVAVDPLIDAYAARVEHFRKEDFPHVCFLSQPLEKADLSGAFDKVFCLNAINHVADLSKSLEKLWDSLAPGGTLTLSVDAHRSKVLAAIFRRLPGDVLHPHQYTWTAYKRLFQSKGIEPFFEVCYQEGRIFDYYVMVARKETSAQAGFTNH